MPDFLKKAIAILCLPAAAGAAQTPFTVLEGSTAFFYVSFLDEARQPVIPDAVQWWVNDDRTHLRTLEPQSCPSGCDPWPASTTALRVPPDGNVILNRRNGNEVRVISVSFRYPPGCSGASCNWGTSEIRYNLIRGEFFDVGGTPPMGPSPASTPTVPTPTISRTATATRTSTRTPTP